ncbi:hypothetical protein CHS0354_001590 [Potamilus streckersoni]|uniref:Uncharacterized protein n=1 Tax=Potamilus streckersoni TaxID=2493646 RepID=A0AAE0W5N3_9BIVA|nr:hypothetical protein CHS0354_001590 [Potamilus streckersoni]
MAIPETPGPTITAEVNEACVSVTTLRRKHLCISARKLLQPKPVRDDALQIHQVCQLTRMDKTECDMPLARLSSGTY